MDPLPGDPMSSPKANPREGKLDTALLILDAQVGIVDQYASSAVMDTLAQVISVARSVRVPIVYVRFALRGNCLEVNRRNTKFASLALQGRFGEEDAETQIHPAVAPLPDDVIVTKKRFGAFSGSDLDIVLRSIDVQHLVMAGITTSGVVLSTLRQAADLDYGVVVLADGCADPDPEVHRVLLDKIFPMQATVLLADTWFAGVAQRE